MEGEEVFHPQFELPESWGEVGQGEPGGYDGECSLTSFLVWERDEREMEMGQR